jgi:V/A-type H+-transporting ATPase subunit E
MQFPGQIFFVKEVRMEVQLQELIDKIKKKGIKQAEADAAKIITNAEEKAKTITDRAKKEAKQLVEKAKRDISSFRESADQALKQAGRDLLLSLKTHIKHLFDAVLTQEVKSVLKGKILEDILLTVVKGWVKKGVHDITILVSPEDHAKLEKFLLSKCASEMKKGVTIKPLPEIKAGFRVMEKDGTAYYNITDQGLAEVLSEYLSPKLAVLLTNTINKGSDS